MQYSDTHDLFYKRINDSLEALERDGMTRSLRPARYGVPYMECGGRRYLNFSSNDYLGIASDDGLAAEFTAANGRFCFGATGSRLLTGEHEVYREFEDYLENLYGRPAITYNSGYHANTGVLPSLAGKGALILADRLVHASIIDGVRFCGADFLRFRHNDMDHLELLIKKHRDSYSEIWVVTESIFSMDGDKCDINSLLDLKYKYGVLLYVDEAHSIGTHGPSGLGMCFASGHIGDIDAAVFPMGKALASHGAFVLCSENVKKYLINTSRTMIFSTALPPSCVAWSHFSVRKMTVMDDRRRHLERISSMLRKELSEAGFTTAGDSHIVPVLMGENGPCLSVAEGLRNSGIWACAIRHPTVPRGQARIRLSVSGVFSEDDIARLAGAFMEIKRTVL